ncbi:MULTISPECIES: MarR family winged helix-turn-helix transcriptional regulator [unclassified Microbacterium]|uniref:MarR family winged helix-turn-helix transcriptional regulator n=1 Tax=unclassified Microbacterium TaxID=2609290 RepID=UPI0012FB762B|nr:MarR family winged helix-turn-helix transcriptional regulator [Microbacterium sp. MAH-37]MVQ40698.1 MarR family transcriptional regulator [Microbacterium sp. MAH-37]
MRETQVGRTPDRLRDRPTWLLGRAAARASALLAGGFEARGNGLRGYHYRLLAALEQFGPSSQIELGRDAGIDRSDVTAALSLMEDRGLVVRAIDPGNRRRKIVSITDTGVARLRELDEMLDGIQEELLAPLSQAQRAQFGKIMVALGEPSSSLPEAGPGSRDRADAEASRRAGGVA